MESIKKVEATRAERMSMEPRRMTAEEKDEIGRVCEEKLENYYNRL